MPLRVSQARQITLSFAHPLPVKTVGRKELPTSLSWNDESLPLLYQLDIVSILMIHKGVEMRVIVKKWGNSASVRIPAAIMEAANLRLNDTVDLREEDGRIVIEQIRSINYDLAQLLADITPENLHTEISYGPAVGKEAF